MAGLAELFVFTYITSNELSRRRPRYDDRREEWYGSAKADQVGERPAVRSKATLCLCVKVEVAQVEAWARFMCPRLRAKPRDGMRNEETRIRDDRNSLVKRRPSACLI